MYRTIAAWEVTTRPGLRGSGSEGAFELGQDLQHHSVPILPSKSYSRLMALN